MAESVDISEGGMSVRPSGGVEVGQVLELEFLLPQVSRPAHPVTRNLEKDSLPSASRHVAGPQKVRAKSPLRRPLG